VKVEHGLLATAARRAVFSETFGITTGYGAEFQTEKGVSF